MLRLSCSDVSAHEDTITVVMGVVATVMRVVLFASGEAKWSAGHNALLTHEDRVLVNHFSVDNKLLGELNSGSVRLEGGQHGGWGASWDCDLLIPAFFHNSGYMRGLWHLGEDRR